MVTSVNDTSEKILLASQNIAAEQGVGQLRVDKVAQAAGVNKRMIYHYFEHKEGLRGCLIEWQLAVLLEVGLSQASGRVARSLFAAIVRETDDVRWPQHHDGEEHVRQAASIVLQYLATMRATDRPERWSEFCTELLSLSVFGRLKDSEYSHSERKPRIRIAATTRRLETD